jgi:hypothetical protein
LEHGKKKRSNTIYKKKHKQTPQKGLQNFSNVQSSKIKNFIKNGQSLEKNQEKVNQELQLSCLLFGNFYFKTVHLKTEELLLFHCSTVAKSKMSQKPKMGTFFRTQKREKVCWSVEKKLCDCNFASFFSQHFRKYLNY